MDAFSDPKVKRVVGVFSAQVAKTTVIENVIGYHVQHDPSPIMVVQPTLEIAEAFSKDRLAPMARDTPALRAKFAAAGSKTSGDTLLHKKFPGGHITLAGANSYNSLASRPIRIVLGDEAAKWKANEKGSPFRQVAARVRAFWNSKQGYFSTPTDAHPDNEFHQLWEQSDKRIFLVPCHRCTERFVYTFDENPASLPTDAILPRAILRWTEGIPTRKEDGRTIRRCSEAWFECSSCGGRIDDGERKRSILSGEWQATQEFYGTAGFWGWQAMSPFSAAKDIANEWLGALGSTTALQSVKNETLGLPWSDTGEAPEWKRLFDRRDLSYTLGSVPDGAILLTAGVDVQPDRIEVQIIGWGRRRRGWLVDYLVLGGDTARQEVWRELTTILGTVYPHPCGVDLTIRKLAIDSGYNTQQVYEWARHHSFGRVAVIKGGPDSQTAPVTAPSPVEISVGGKRLASGLKMQMVNGAHFKSELYSVLKLDLPNLEKSEQYPDGWFAFPALGDTEEYCRQLTAEQVVTRTVKGYLRREWEKMRPRNEALDTWVYARAAAFMMGVDRYSEHHWLNIEKQLGITSDPNEVKVPPVQSKPHSPDFASNEPAPVPSSDPFNRLERGGSYFGNRKGWFGR
jgi:phage terminase large subunit GpA-like protein